MGRPGTGPVPEVDGLLMIAPHVGTIRPNALKAVDVVLALGDEPDKTMVDFSKAVGLEPPEIPATQLDREHALGWWRHDGTAAFVFRYVPGSAERLRHIRKYAAGDVGDKSFYFQGPDGKLNLRAQNLQLFVQVGEGVDDATWLHHLRQGDYSRWFREAIKDDALAGETEEIERQYADDPATSRARIREAIEGRYTAPA
jgi:hypothetical protein